MTKAKNLLIKMRPFGYGAFFGPALVVITWAVMIILPSFFEFFHYIISLPVYPLLLIPEPFPAALNALGEFICPTPEMYKGTAYWGDCQGFLYVSSIFILNSVFYGIIFQVIYFVYRRLKKSHA